MPPPTIRSSVLEFTGDMSLAARHRLAVQDVLGGLALWRLAWTLGWLDIRLRYRGSLLGPFWLTLSTAIMVASLGFLYSVLFHTELHDYLPFLALSQVLWFFLSSLVTEGCSSFTQAEGVIRSVRMPLFLHAMRTLVRNVLVFGHNIAVIVVVDIVFAVWPTPYAVLALPALVLWAIDALAVGLLLGAFCARFRDIPPIVGSIVQIAFFMTPVIWQPSQLGAGGWWLPLNPFYSLLEIAREPLLHGVPSGVTWLSAILYSVLLWVVSWLFFVRARGRVAFWL